MKNRIFARLAALGAAAALSVTTALASPAAMMLRTEYERQQQALPLFERDKLIAEPKLLALAIILAVYITIKLRHDYKKRMAEDEVFRQKVAEAERLEAMEEAANAYREQQAAEETELESIPEVEAEVVGVDETPDEVTVIDAETVPEEGTKTE